MKKFRLIAVFLAVLAVFILIATPVFAAPPPLPSPEYPNVNGIEIFAGIDFANINWGATFIAQAKVPYGTDTYNCALTASIDYTPDHPISGGTNSIVGGSFTLNSIQKGKSGMIKGKILNDGLSSVNWLNGTDYGHVFIPDLQIVSASGVFASVKGGIFDGYDDHVDGPKVFGITVPIVIGFLSLN